MSDTAALTAGQAQNLQYAAMGTSALSTVGSTIANVGAIKAQGNYLSSVAQSNAAMANLKATQTLQAGDIAASRKNLETQIVGGAAKATEGGSGVQVGSGSNAMTQSEIRTIGGIDEATIRNNAARQAWGYQTQATQEQYAGQFAQLTAGAKAEQTYATGGLQAVGGPLAMYSQSALWQYRYGGRGTPGAPYPSASNSGGMPDMGVGNTEDSDFWGN